ncbi:MAG: hypothetical protein WC755_02450 [Candidatus Woesearchaeota archaeon]|jgi:hypothetical protein
MIGKRNIKDDIVSIIESCGGSCGKDQLIVGIAKRAKYSFNYFGNIVARINNGQIKNDIGLYRDKYGNLKFNKRIAKENGYGYDVI